MEAFIILLLLIQAVFFATVAFRYASRHPEVAKSVILWRWLLATVFFSIAWLIVIFVIIPIVLIAVAVILVTMLLLVLLGLGIFCFYKLRRQSR